MLIGFKYSADKYIFKVKKLKQKSKSAGKIFNIKNGTSETLRSGIAVRSEQVKSVSEHVPKHVKPLNNEQFGHYLAGLIDGDGHFSKIQQLVLVFSTPDAFLAYYVKQKLGYGTIKKVKDKNAYLLTVSNKNGLLSVLNLINGKIRTQHRFNQVINNVLSNIKYNDLDKKFTINSTTDLNNHWLAGFSDADASFQIKVINREARDKQEIRLNYQIDQKHNILLNIIKDYLGGNIGYIKSQDTYYYGSTSFGSAKKVIQYFDKFNLQSSKHISFLKWRKVYILILCKKHLTEQGLDRILKIKSSINKHEHNAAIQDKVLTKI